MRSRKATASAIATMLSKFPDGARIERTCGIWQVQLAPWLDAVNSSDLHDALHIAAAVYNDDNRGSSLPRIKG